MQRAPDSFAARHRLAGFYLQQGKVPAAIPHLQRAQQIDPSQYAVGYDLAVALSKPSGWTTRARRSAGWLKLKDVGEVHNLLGDLEERAGNLVAAAEEYQRAAHMDPSEEHLFDWGDNLLQLRAYDAGRRGVHGRHQASPALGRLHVGLGIALYSRGEYQDAVQSFCDAADLAPSDPRPYQFLGEMYGVAPELGGEISTRLARFVETHPKNALAHFHYAMSLWKGGGEAPGRDDSAAIERLLKRAVAARPTADQGVSSSWVCCWPNSSAYDEAIEISAPCDDAAAVAVAGALSARAALSADRPQGSRGEGAGSLSPAHGASGGDK